MIRANDRVRNLLPDLEQRAGSARAVRATGGVQSSQRPQLRRGRRRPERHLRLAGAWLAVEWSEASWLSSRSASAASSGVGVRDD
jgi:hypothetical protein